MIRRRPLPTQDVRDRPKDSGKRKDSFQRILWPPQSSQCRGPAAMRIAIACALLPASQVNGRETASLALMGALSPLMSGHHQYTTENRRPARRNPSSPAADGRARCRNNTWGLRGRRNSAPGRSIGSLGSLRPVPFGLVRTCRSRRPTRACRRGRRSTHIAALSFSCSPRFAPGACRRPAGLPQSRACKRGRPESRPRTIRRFELAKGFGQKKFSLLRIL
jgi:hypothetical protein